MARPKTPHVKWTLRLPPEIHATLKQAASESERSLNSEIVNRLKLSLEGWKR